MAGFISYLGGTKGRLAMAFASALIALCVAGCSDRIGAHSGARSADAENNAVAAADARFAFPVGIAADAYGSVYVADTGNSTIRKISPVGIVSTIAGKTGEKGHVDGTGAVARFERPTALTLDASGNLYVIDANAIRRITPDGDVVTFAGMPSEAGLADRHGPAALFSGPQGITADVEGNLYVADSGNRAIRKVTPSGDVSTLMRIEEEPIHSVVSWQDRLYVGGEYCVWRVEIGSRGSTALARIGGEIGTYGNVDGESGMRFWPIVGITADQAGNIYASQSFARPKGQPPHGVIRKLIPSEDKLRFTAATLAGNPSSAGNTDGMGSSALFNLPQGIAVDANGNLFVADSLSNTIRKITAAGKVTTIAGKTGNPSTK